MAFNRNRELCKKDHAKPNNKIYSCAGCDTAQKEFCEEKRKQDGYPSFY